MQTSLKSIEEQRAEALRQTEFIAETRSYVLELEQTLGRPLKSNVTTFGCQFRKDPGNFRRSRLSEYGQ